MQPFLKIWGYRAVPLGDKNTPNLGKCMKNVREFTMTSIERMYALYKAVEYIVKAETPGDFLSVAFGEAEVQ